MTKYCLNELEEYFNSLREEGIIYKGEFVLVQTFMKAPKNTALESSGLRRKSLELKDMMENLISTRSIVEGDSGLM